MEVDTVSNESYNKIVDTVSDKEDKRLFMEKYGLLSYEDLEMRDARNR